MQRKAGGLAPLFVACLAVPAQRDENGWRVARAAREARAPACSRPWRAARYRGSRSAGETFPPTRARPADRARLEPRSRRSQEVSRARPRRRGDRRRGGRAVASCRRLEQPVDEGLVGLAEKVRAAAGSRTANSLPRPGPSLCDGHRAAVQLRERSHERQAEAEPTLRAVGAARALDEGLEQIREERRLDADACVAHAKDDRSRPRARR